MRANNRPEHAPRSRRIFRGLHPPQNHKSVLQKTFGRTPEIAAVSLFVASTATEITQRYWPNGIFRGRFEILDVAAYAAGLTARYAAEKILSPRKQSWLAVVDSGGESN